MNRERLSRKREDFTLSSLPSSEVLTDSLRPERPRKKLGKRFEVDKKALNKQMKGEVNRKIQSSYNESHQDMQESGQMDQKHF